MALYTAQTNSPSTTLASAAASSATSITLANGSIFANLDLPNYLTLGYTQANSETVLVTAINGNTATVTRGVDGTATDWAVDTPVARVFTAKDWNDMITEKAAASSVPSAYTSTPAMNGTGSAGTGTAYARGNHVHPTDTSRAPTDHATSATTYGKGTGTNYGHLKLSDSTSSTSSTSGGIAATPSAVKSAYDLANGRQAQITATGLLVGAGSGTVNAATIGSNLTLDNGTLSSAGLTSYTATLTTTWGTSGGYKTQTVTVSGLKASYNIPPIVDVNLSGTDATADAALLEAWALVGLVETGANSITAKCTGDAPSVQIPLTIMVWE